ncbi:dihydropteroate synthase [Marinospirillum celere]|uniref:Dihydropteroate synthase n=1 Tax=Marinospirillum celere TaxID=1122252 RepID=A0A1I1IC11_9GAMM|nr:dihydropteroate synthase [Marinospirillum celere]SFC33786.1 dihydropteroate synthase [Marinospirillum celere]
MQLKNTKRVLDLTEPRIMGIVNLTPDSFSDGGRLQGVDAALEHALRLEKEGADLLDLGGESTRPGAAKVSVQEEMDRVLPVLEALRKETSSWISIDTSTPEVMTEAARLGADLINDVRALRRPGALQAAAKTGLPVCLMHMKGEPGFMQQEAHYDDLLQEITDFLNERITACEQAGIQRSALLLDPGFGFAKLLKHNLALLNNLGTLLELQLPLLVGLSRKRMLGEITGREVHERQAASYAVHLLAAQKGAKILRVHDVAGMKDSLAVWQAMLNAEI